MDQQELYDALQRGDEERTKLMHEQTALMRQNAEMLATMLQLFQPQISGESEADFEVRKAEITAADIKNRRDMFAAQSLTGLCANSGGPYQANSQSGWGLVNCTAASIAREAYALADAMIAARSA